MLEPKKNMIRQLFSICGVYAVFNGASVLLVPGSISGSSSELEQESLALVLSA